MSDKWEVVSGPKKRPKTNVVANGGHSQQPVKVNTIPGAGVPKKPKKPSVPSAKTPAAFPLMDGTNSDSEREDKDNKETKVKASKKPKSPGKVASEKKVREKPKDLESTLEYKVSPEELSKFYDDLTNSGAVGDVYLSYIKYTADALNSKVNSSSNPSANQWPNDLTFPTLPLNLKETINSIIIKTVELGNESTDVLGLSFSSLLASIPPLIQRGDPGWGYLIFLRQMCELDPSLPVRRSRSVTELMESYGNKKDIGLCILWVIAQAAMHSANELKITTAYLLPFYHFKHYKSFISSVFNSLSSRPVDMAASSTVEPEEFDEFFESAFDPKKRRDLEKFYDRVKSLTLRNLGNKGSELFARFLPKIGSKDFMPLSVYGKEVFDVLIGCLENDTHCMNFWKQLLPRFPKESAALLNHMSKEADKIRFGKRLESKLIQSDEFAAAAVKNPELLRGAKKFQVGFQKAEAARKRFSWKMASFIVLLTIIGIIWLDITENGNGQFEKSNMGKFLDSYGLLQDFMAGLKMVSNFIKYLYEVSSVLFRSIYEALQPLLQTIEEQLEIYIPQLSHYCKLGLDYVYDVMTFIITFLQENVFVGALAPENLRKLTKEYLSLIWTTVYRFGEQIYAFIEKNIQAYLN